MNIESLKRWHWVAIGLIVGLALAAAKLLGRADEAVGGDGFIDQAQFERGLRMPPVMGKAQVSSIVVHPRGAVDIVTLRLLDMESLQYRQVKFAAPRSYQPLGTSVAGGSGREVIDYLAELSAGNRSITARYAWWDKREWIVTLYMFAGAVTVGGIWPTLLRLLVGAGLGRKEPDYDLDRFHRGPEPAKQQGLSESDEQRLRELEAEMMAGLRSADTPQSKDATAPPAPIAALSQEQLAPTPVAQADGPREYSGEYYPVEKHAPHAFTLVEMLVVVGIISVLIAVLMPALTMARRQAEATQCASNLHQMGMALQMYSQANGGWLPAWSGWHTWPVGLSDDSPGPAWTIELMPYIGRPDSPVYNCPSFRSPVKCRNYFLAAQWSGRSGRHAMKLSDVTMTSRFVLGGEKTQRGLYPPPFGQSEHQSDDADPDDFGAGRPVLAWPWDQGGFYMHSHGNNILFDDLHVAIFPNYAPAAMTFNPRRMQNWPDVTGDAPPDQSGG